MPPIDPPTAMIVRAIRGERDACGMMYECYVDRVFRYVVLRLGDAADAWDLTQDIFIKVIQAISTLDDPDRFDAWLFKIAHNAVLNRWRARRRRDRWVDSTASVFDDTRNDPQTNPTGSDDELDIYGQLLDGAGEALGSRVEQNVAIATGPGLQLRPDVAFSPVAGAYLVVWSQETGARTQDFDIYGRFVDGDGKPLGPALAISAAPGNQHAPVVAYHSTSRRFLVVWQEGDENGTADLVGAFVDPAVAGPEPPATPTMLPPSTETLTPVPPATPTAVPTETSTVPPPPTATSTVPAMTTWTAVPSATATRAAGLVHLPIALRGVPPPQVELTEVPICGDWGPLKGRVTNGWPQIDLTQHKVAVYIRVEGGWWTKPTFAQPLTAIAPDGTWTCDCFNAGLDNQATEIAAFVVPDTLWPERRGGQSNRPIIKEAVAHVATERPCDGKALDFSGRRWRVKASVSAVDPGPSPFSDRPEDVFVDDHGRLHLRIAQHNGDWHSSEVLTDQSLGYGTYTFGVDSRLDEIDPNAVLGLFTYDTAPDFSHREIDIEFSRWSDPANDVGQFVVQPYTNPRNMFRFPVGSRVGETTHRFDWRAGRIEFHSFYGRDFPPAPGDLIAHWIFQGAGVPREGAGRARINLWQFKGAAPARGQAQEIVINRFEFAR